MSTAHARWWATAALIACATGLLATLIEAPARAAGPTITGAGSSFTELEMDQWRRDVAQRGLLVNYSASSSGLGRTQFAQGIVDFAGTDIPYQTEDPVKASQPFLYLNVSAGGLAFMFHLTDTQGNRVSHLNLTPREVCRLFTYTGSTNYWDAPDIQADNPDVALPHERVASQARSDTAGTSYILMQFCIADAPDVWRAAIDYCNRTCPTTQAAAEPFVDGQPHSVWPIFCCAGAGDADTIANTVASSSEGEGAIAYIETGFAKVRGFPVASIRNSSGAYTQPTAHNVNEALAFATTAGDGTLRLAFDAPRPDVYFPSTYSYILVPTSGLDPAKGVVLAGFLDYAVTGGQDQAEPLGYAPLACGIVNSALDNITHIPGAPARPAYPCQVPNPDTSPVAGPVVAGGSPGPPSPVASGEAATPDVAVTSAPAASRAPAAAIAPPVGRPSASILPGSIAPAVVGGSAAPPPLTAGTSPQALTASPLSTGEPIPPSLGDVVLTMLAGAAASALVVALRGLVTRRARR